MVNGYHWFLSRRGPTSHSCITRRMANWLGAAIIATLVETAAIRGSVERDVHRPFSNFLLFFLDHRSSSNFLLFFSSFLTSFVAEDIAIQERVRTASPRCAEPSTLITKVKVRCGSRCRIRGKKKSSGFFFVFFPPRFT